MLDGPVVAIIVLAIGGLLAGAYFTFEHRRHRRGAAKAHVHTAERLPLFRTDMLATRGGDGVLHESDAADGGEEGGAVPRHRPFPLRRVAPMVDPSPHSAVAPTPFPGNGWSPAPARANGHAAEPAPAGAWAAHARPGAPAGVAPLAGATPAPLASPALAGDPTFANGETLRFALPDEGTLRFLPGRLEVVAGPDAGREVRFVAPPNLSDGVQITFGRTEGPPYRHVQLLARTVSRRHALMSLIDEHWSLQNLSATNPVLLNGRALAPDEVAPLLVDGDRIEMGEVVFTFHSR
jgi:pSer/pThr/pTyr-binding forkhead associated (FHA) protein